ncbi:MAG: sugar phosphate isomerase/epimerase [Spirochaetaceae bacterium]
MIGTRGHDINTGTTSARALAQEMLDAGMEAVQLVVYKSIKGVSEKPGCLSPGLAWSIGREFEKRDIHIALLGSYFNLLEQDSLKLKENMDRFKEYLRFASDFGCPIVGTETGSYNADMSYHPHNHGEEALQTVIGIFKEFAVEAEHHGVFVGVEGLYNFVISTPKRMKTLLDSVDSSNLQVILDPVNLLHMGNYTKVKEIIEDSFELFGNRIVLIHAKDFIIEDHQIKTVPLGRGLMDYEHLLTMVNRYKPGIDIIIEDLRGDELQESQLYLQSIIDKLDN